MHPLKKYLDDLYELTRLEPILMYYGDKHEDEILEDDYRALEAILKTIHSDQAILIIQSEGGNLLGSLNIVAALKTKFKRVYCAVPKIAGSCAGHIVLACTEIWMDKDSTMTQMDSVYDANGHGLRLIEKIRKKEVDDGDIKNYDHSIQAYSAVLGLLDSAFNNPENEGNFFHSKEVLKDAIHNTSKRMLHKKHHTSRVTPREMNKKLHFNVIEKNDSLDDWKLIKRINKVAEGELTDGTRILLASRTKLYRVKTDFSQIDTPSSVYEVQEY